MREWETRGHLPPTVDSQPTPQPGSPRWLLVDHIGVSPAKIRQAWPRNADTQMNHKLVSNNPCWFKSLGFKVTCYTALFAVIDHWYNAQYLFAESVISTFMQNSLPGHLMRTYFVRSGERIRECWMQIVMKSRRGNLEQVFRVCTRHAVVARASPLVPLPPPLHPGWKVTSELGLSWCRTTEFG